MVLKKPRLNKTKPHIAQRHAIQQEKQIAERIGGTTIKGSGCGEVRGDVRLKHAVRIENKCTTKKSFSINLEMIEKIENAALQASELPVIQIEFIDEVSGRIKHKMVVIPDYVLDMIVDRVKE